MATPTYKPSSLRIYRENYLVEEPPAVLSEAERGDLDRLETALRLFDAAAPPARRLSASVYFSRGTRPSAYVTLMDAHRGVGLLTAGSIREAALIADAAGLSASL
jgi:hypothetical protein